MFELEIFDSLRIYLFKYCLFGFSISIPFKEAQFKLYLVPISVDDFWFRYVNGCKCCDMFLFNLEIPFTIETSLYFYTGKD